MTTTGSKHLVELKARYEDLGKARALLHGAEHLDTVRQTDTYFAIGDRRLKLRAVAGRADGQIIYYERPDLGGVKESRVLLGHVEDIGVVLEMLRNVFPVLAEVRKTREIYRLEGVQVHLDVVEGLGRFIEFEKVLTSEADREAALAKLESLRGYFDIGIEDLMASSYSDLVA